MLRQAAAPLLHDALKKKDSSLEMRLRIEQLLQQLEAQSPQQVFKKRAVMALELIGTPEAAKVLHTLVQKMPNTILGRDAQESWQRLQKKASWCQNQRPV